MPIEFTKCKNIQAYVVTQTDRHAGFGIGMIYQDVSGYWYIEFEEFVGGVDEYTLKVLYEKLRELNNPLDENANEYFSKDYFKHQKELLE